MTAIAIAITLVLTGRPWQWELLRIVTDRQVHVFTVVNRAGLIMISLVAPLRLRTIAGKARRDREILSQ
ncbi:hypothetical protein ACIBQ1_31375 [Nonomuraea sp. NPDC050153]|uniref:hypothetical protein n=1 Tax=Nonomuraea sp. NPDC050153 TaxID=3364359 RepID=UPI003789D756